MRQKGSQTELNFEDDETLDGVVATHLKCFIIAVNRFCENEPRVTLQNLIKIVAESRSFIYG